MTVEQRIEAMEEMWREAVAEGDFEFAARISKEIDEVKRTEREAAESRSDDA